MHNDTDIIDQAIGWHLRQAALSDAEWVEFIAWLEQDPAHARAFDRVATADRLLPSMPQPMPAGHAANDDAPPARRWLWGVGGVAVAATFAMLFVPRASPPAPYVVATQAGQRETVRLPDGTRIELNGGTRLTLDHNDTRIASLDSGEATFHVRHDEHAPFTLRSGGVTVRDMGTIFNVARSGPELDVQVAEGSVMFQPDGDAIILRPGQSLVAHEDTRRVTLGKVAPDTVGGWRHGRLSFSGEPLADVFASIHRLYGTNVTLEGDLSGRPFTGMVDMTGNAARDIPHLAALIGVGWRRDGERWVLTPHDKTPQ